MEQTQKALAAETEARRSLAAAAAEAQAQAEKDRRELDIARADLRSLDRLAGAEKARADALARALADAARQPDPLPAPTRTPAPATSGASARTADPPPVAPTASPPVAPTAVPTAPTAPTSSATPGPAPLPPPIAHPAVPAVPTPPAVSPSASREPADLERVRTTVNQLLEGTSGAARYQIEAMDGVSGQDLLGLRVVGRDESGRTLRTIEAPSGEIRVGEDGTVRLLFRDGQLVVGGRRAPFFDGAYSVRLTSTAAAWKASGLTCVRFD